MGWFSIMIYTPCITSVLAWVSALDEAASAVLQYSGAPYYKHGSAVIPALLDDDPAVSGTRTACLSWCRDRTLFNEPDHDGLIPAVFVHLLHRSGFAHRDAAAPEAD